jgi:two-component system chemotaxis response regulator CheY
MSKIDYSRLNILLIEDESYTRVITRRIINQIGVREVAEAKGGVDALGEIVRARPDIIFCDINMGAMGGFEFLEQFRTITSADLDRTWVVMLTADSSYENRLKAQEHSVAGYMVKPVSLNQIKEQIDAIIDNDPELAARVHHGLPVDYGKLRVLIVDDEEIVRQTIKKMLGQFGVTITAEATDGMKGLMEVAKFKPNLILCDVHMKPLGGLKFLEGLRQLNMKGIEDTPVVMITGDSNADTVKEAQALKVSGYLIKPTTTKELKARIEHAIRSTPKLFAALRKPMI